MKFNPTSLKGSYTIDPEAIQDNRGWFVRYFDKKEFSIIGHDKEWVQMNHSFTEKKGSIRGMHFQVSPFNEIKLVKCISGAVFDVIIDLRRDSPSFLQWFSTELSASNKRMIYIPEGFAHGFQCIEDNCELIYLHSEYYMKGSEAGIRYDDPNINIKWPLEATVISERDKNHKLTGYDFKGF